MTSHHRRASNQQQPWRSAAEGPWHEGRNPHDAGEAIQTGGLATGTPETPVASFFVLTSEADQEEIDRMRKLMKQAPTVKQCLSPLALWPLSGNSKLPGNKANLVS